MVVPWVHQFPRIVSNLFMEELERRALSSFSATVRSHWFRYVDDTWVKIQRRESEAFSAHLNKTDKYVKLTHKDIKENSLAFLDCAVKMEEDRNLSIEVYRKPTHTDQYLGFDSHHPHTEHKFSSVQFYLYKTIKLSLGALQSQKPRARTPR